MGNECGRQCEQVLSHGDLLVLDDRVIASADVDKAAGVEAGVHAFERQSGRELLSYRAARGVLGAVVGIGRRAFANSITTVVNDCRLECNAATHNAEVLGRVRGCVSLS
jgi:hypothetical protein